MLRWTWRIAAAAVLIAGPMSAVAQQPTTGSISGQVLDNEGKPLPGATITLAGPGGNRATQSDAEGNFSFAFVSTGTYRMRVEMEGFAPTAFSQVGVAAGQTTRVPVKMAAGRTEEVTVTSASPLVDTKRVEVQTTFKTDQAINTMPIGRNFVAAVAFAPGVVSGGGTGAGNYSIGGSSGLENSYVIDGVNITSSGYGGVGTYSQVFGSLGTGITSDFLEEVQVKTAGFEAEYGQALGGIVSGTVKSGGNDLKGRVAAYYSPRNLTAFGNDVSLVGGATNIHDRQRTDVGLQAGGPIVADRLFWFVAYNPVSEWDDVFLNAQNATNPVASDLATRSIYPDPVALPGAFAGGIRGRRDYNNYAAKINGNLTTNQRLELTAFGDPSRGYGGRGIFAGDRGVTASTPFNLTGTTAAGPVSIVPASFGQGGLESTVKWGAHQQSLKYNGLFGTDWFLEAQVSNRTNKFRETQAVDEFNYIDYRPQLLTGVQLRPTAGGVGYYAPIDDKTRDYALKLTKTLGTHELKVGAEYFDLRYDEVSRYSGPSFTVPFAQFEGEDIPIPTTTGAIVQVRGGLGTGNCDPTNPIYSTGSPCDAAPQYRVVRTRFTNPGETKGRELAFFAQDTWSITDRWTLKLGVRTQSQKLEGSGAFTLPFSADPEHPGYYTTTPRTYTPNTYTFPLEWSPRIGLSFDPTARGGTKIYANVARYFERVPSDLAVRAFSNEVGASQLTFTDPTLTTRRGATGNFLLQGLNATEIKNNTRLPYKDELVVGWQQLVRPDLSVEVRGIYRRQGRVLEDTQNYTVEEIENFYYGAGYGLPLPFPNAPAEHGFGSYVLANPGRNTGSGFGDPKMQYRALELQIEKRLSDDWQAFANYRYSRLTGNYEGLFRNDNAQSDPNITSLFDFPDSNIMRGQYQTGYLNNDRPHVLHIGGTRFFKNGIEAGAIFNWQSGNPRTPLLAHPNYQNAGELPGRDPIYTYWDPTLAGGAGDWARQPTCNGNPGETPCFLYDYTDAPRGSNGRVPDLATLDVHLGWGLNMARDMRLKFALDVTNVFNSQEPQQFNDFVESTASVLNANYLRVSGYQLPRQIRLSALWDW